ncbi:MAG: hypothetical protein JNM84_02565 [Planctomycetes bacterium]|nr:hypothetical protein [Planctomycetota bacterium]
MSVRFPVYTLLLTLSAGQLPAQSPTILSDLLAQERNARTSPAPYFGVGIFRSPIHTQEVDQGLGAYGIWASGDTYKASFHDGFVFYPLLGESYPENLPLRWTTTRISVAGESIADLASGVHAHGDWRYEYRFGGVTEAYDVLADAVEQTFVIEKRPPKIGDLVVEGRVATELRASAAEAAHQALVFTDAAGNPIVRYSEAFAFDAAGRRTEVATGFDGETVRLVLSGSWLEHAVFPVTVDPLTNAYLLSSYPGRGAENPSVHREDESPLLNTMVTYSRAFSAGDYDVYASLGAADLQSSTLVFADATSNWSSLLPDVAYVGGADRWIVGFWRHTSTDDRMRVYFHDREDLVLNSGHVATEWNPAGEHATFPSIGGTSHPTEGVIGILAYRADPFFGNSNNSRVRATMLNAVSRTFAGVVTLNGDDAESPDVTCQLGWGDDSWVVVYQYRHSATDDYDVFAQRVRPDLITSRPMQLGPDHLGDKVRPVVQGWDGRFLCAMLQDVTAEINGQHFGRNVLVQRFDWPAGQSNAMLQPYRTVSRSTSQDLTKLNLAYDGVTLSHWCLVHDSDVFTSAKTQVRRLGWTGGVTESTDLGAVSYQAAVSWNGVQREFQIVNCSNESLAPLWGRLLQHSNASWHIAYGASCGPGVISSDTVPYPGSQFYRVTLQNAPPNQPGLLLLSTGAGSLDLAPFGAANCFVNLAQFDVVLPTDTGPTGSVTHGFSLPDVPLFRGDLYWQFVYTWPAAPTTLRIGVTRGLRASVR